MLESYDSKALCAIFCKIVVVVIVVKVLEGMHDMQRIITNRDVPHTHIVTSHVFIVCIHVYMRQFTKEFSLKMTWATYIHIYFSYLLPPDSFFINKGKTTTTLRQLPRYISYAQSALFFKICA